MAYDEIYQGDIIRPLYRKHLLDHSRLTISERKLALKRAGECVSKDARFLPLVRLLTESEYRDVVAGVRQRGRALRLFLIDHYFGTRTYERAGIITSSEVERIRNRYYLPPIATSLSPENIQFWYAPDIIRDANGKFRVIEDNIGFVGGIGDLEAFADASRALGVSIPSRRHPRAFYRGMVEIYQREARRVGGGKTILLSYPQAHRSIHEDKRLARALGAYEVTNVTNFRTLKLRADGLFHDGERVGFVIINRHLEDIDHSNLSLERSTYFWKLVSEGKLGVSYSPGVEFVGDKKFYLNVESLVEHYLREKCLVPSIETITLDKKHSLRRVQREREAWVIKRCKGQSGESVWVGRHSTDKAWLKVLNRVQRKPSDFIAQRYCEPSQFLDHDVDLRPLAVISGHGERVSPIPWGRAAAEKKSKTNIATGGLLAPVAIVSRNDVR